MIYVCKLDESGRVVEDSERRGRGGRREKERKIDENRETRFSYSSLDLEASVGQERCTWKIEATNRNTIKKLNRNGGKETG